MKHDSIIIHSSVTAMRWTVQAGGSRSRAHCAIARIPAGIAITHAGTSASW